MFDLAPSTHEDLPTTFRQYCEATDVATRPRLAHTLKSSRASRAQLEAVIEIAEQDGSEACRSALLAVLANDWSRRGRDYLYKMATAATDHNRQMEILKVLLSRRQFSLVPHQAMMDQTTDPAVLDRLAEIAEKAAMIGGDMEARQFLLSELGAPQPVRRELAVDIIARHDRTVRHAMRDQMLQAVRQETDAPTRAAMVKSLVHITMDNVNEFLVDILENDKALEVRIAAVEAISMVSGAPATVQMIGRLQALIDEDAPEALKTALADKLARVERAREKREQRKAERLKRMEDKGAPPDD
ncbi:MAG TPA: HEAT repeat domain-containing protein [Phycisphaerae bacterium]|nr:HEAT repeat domain-containing protein [Phycisphaerae bacterium]